MRHFYGVFVILKLILRKRAVRISIPQKWVWVNDDNFILNYFFTEHSSAFRKIGQTLNFQKRGESVWGPKTSLLSNEEIVQGHSAGLQGWVTSWSPREKEEGEKQRERRHKRGTKELRWMWSSSRWDDICRMSLWATSSHCKACNLIGPRDTALTNGRQPVEHERDEISYGHSVLTCNMLSKIERNLVPSTMNRAILSQSLAAVAAKLRSLTALW